MILSVTHSTANRIDALNRFFPYLPISGEYGGIGLVFRKCSLLSRQYYYRISWKNTSFPIFLVNLDHSNLIIYIVVLLLTCECSNNQKFHRKTWYHQWSHCCLNGSYCPIKISGLLAHNCHFLPLYHHLLHRRVTINYSQPNSHPNSYAENFILEAEIGGHR